MRLRQDGRPLRKQLGRMCKNMRFQIFKKVALFSPTLSDSFFGLGQNYAELHPRVREMRGGTFFGTIITLKHSLSLYKKYRMFGLLVCRRQPAEHGRVGHGMVRKK